MKLPVLTPETMSLKGEELLNKIRKDFIGLDRSSQVYDRPWYYSNNREINFFVRVEFN